MSIVKEGVLVCLRGDGEGRALSASCRMKGMDCWKRSVSQRWRRNGERRNPIQEWLLTVEGIGKGRLS